MKRVFLTALTVIFAITDSAEKRDLTYFWKDKNGVIDAQTELTLELVDSLLLENPPTSENPSNARKAALYMLDQIFHDTRLDGSPIVRKYLDHRMGLVLDDLKKPAANGIKVKELLN